ncbi:MAG: transpeptidase family protein [Candidatus Azobacteroides sp.]|nr:transpeptidase family protein [Candidatus Azobacteroides sp.]
MADKNNIENKKIQRNYFIVALILGLLIVSIIGKAFVTSFVEGSRWIEIGKKYSPFHDSIPAPRGNIFSSDGELMAVSETYYQLYMDFWADGMNDSILKANVKLLSVQLNKQFPEKSAAQYETNILIGLKMRQKEAERIAGGEENVAKKSREYPLAVRPVDYLGLKAIKQMPFFNLGRNRSGLYERKLMKRIKPFDILASRTIGDIWDGVKGVGGKTGLELGYDSLLQGKPGEVTVRWVEGRFKEIPEIDPVPGKDIISTIDINIQSITENALMDKLKELDAESGTAVVMEVKTGEVKAIANLKRYKEGAWDEIQNYALSDMSEPGSTFKVASMMVALEDSVVHPDDPVDVGNGKFEYGGFQLLDHNANRGGYGKITAAKAIWFSSNIGVAKIILKGYEKNPGKYVDGLYKIGFNKDLNLEIPGYGRAKIRHPKDSTRTWSKTTLPWMSFGYETQIPPIYTLTFFNAIANNGTMIKPIFVKEIRDARKIEKKKTEIINEHICSDKTLEIIREMLDSVVNHPHGTGKPARSDLVRIAGKTGTAQLSQGAAGYKAGGKSHQVSFCGYFPANDPKYSCIVVIRRPRNGNASGGYMSGAVFKRIAEAIYTQDVAVAKPIILDKEIPVADVPKVKSGLSDYSKYVLNKLNIHYTDSLKGNWIRPQWTADRLVLKEQTIKDNAVPDVIGMGAKDAVYALESAGLQVNLFGKGAVYSQSLVAGATALRGQTITIQLK